MASIPHGIRSVKIENFRGLDKLELDFTDPQGNPSDVVVIGGPNGCGKTAVLEACYTLATKDQDFSQTRGFSQDAVRQGATGYILSMIARVNDNNVTCSLRYNTNSLDFGTAEPPFPEAVYISSRRQQSLVGSLSISLGSSLTPDEPQTSFDRTDDNGYWQHQERSRLRNLKQDIVDLKAFESMGGGGLQSHGSRTVLDKLTGLWKLFYPRGNEYFQVGPVGSNPHDGFDVFLVRPDGPRIPLDLLSSGQLELVIVFGALTITQQAPRLVIIDEPELHLDPQWHATLLHELRRSLPKSQFIVATHSPRIAESVNSYQRFYLVPEGDPRMAAWRPTNRTPEPAHV